jgi:hypothetical protein
MFHYVEPVPRPMYLVNGPMQPGVSISGLPHCTPGKCGGSRLQVHPNGKGEFKELLYHFHNGLKFQRNHFFRCHKTSNTQIWILWPQWLCLDTADP